MRDDENIPLVASFDYAAEVAAHWSFAVVDGLMQEKKFYFAVGAAEKRTLEA